MLQPLETRSVKSVAVLRNRVQALSSGHMGEGMAFVVSPSWRTCQRKELPKTCRELRSTPQCALSRRAAMSRSAAALLALAIDLSGHQAGPVYGYSSPYSPANREADKDLPERRYDASQIVTTPSGLRYFDLSEGKEDGPVAKVGDSVVCAYTSRLAGLNGVKLDSSYDKGADFRFVVGADNVVPGVNETVTGMRLGGKRRAVVPPSLGYKNADTEPSVTEFFARRRLLSVLNTARDATIVFDIELLRIR